jgi:cytochrome c-type biogenesis protein CcmH/NrfG
MADSGISIWITVILMATMMMGIIAYLMRAAAGQEPNGGINGGKTWIILIALLAGTTIYGMLGKPDMADAPLYLRADALQKKAAIEAMQQNLANSNLAEARKQLDENPDDIVAMLMLAEAAAAAGQYDTEIAALEQALDITGHPTIRSMLAEALTRQADGIVTERAADLLLESLTEHLDDWRAAYLYGLYLSQNGKEQEAIIVWQDLGRRASREENGARMLELVNAQLRDMAVRTGQPEDALIIIPVANE